MICLGEYLCRTFKPRVGLYKKGLTYDKQGAIYFACKHYFTLLTDEEKQRFKRLLWNSAKCKENTYNAMFEYLTGELSAREIGAIYDIPKTTLYRYLDDFYLNFEYVKIVY